MSLFALSEDESTSSLISLEDNQIEKLHSNSSDDIKSLQTSQLNVSTHWQKLFSNEYHQKKGLNNNDQRIELTEQTNTSSDVNQITKNLFQKLHPSEQAVRTPRPSSTEQYATLNMMTDNTPSIETSIEENVPVPENSILTPSSETSQLIVVTTSINLKDLLCYQDVMTAIQREFNLHDGQEREIIMTLWLRGQTMVSILQRFRHLLQDLNIDDKDFVNSLQQLREMISYNTHDIEYLREYTTTLENQNSFLENEFRRQLDRIVQEKNDQIARLIHAIDQTCTPPTDYQDSNDGNNKNHSSENEELLKKFMQQNVELQREIETLRAKLEYTFTFINEKFDENKLDKSSTSIIQTAFEQMRQTETKFQELKFKLMTQQEENDLLKYFIEKSQLISTIERKQLIQIIEQRSLQRELVHLRYELDLTEKKTKQFEEQFETADETVKFYIEKLKLKCEILQKHILTCTQRLEEIHQQDLSNENQSIKSKKHSEESNDDKKVIQLENDLLILRGRYDESLEHSNTIKFELNNLRKEINEKEKLESSTNSDLERERRYTNQLENELKSLKIKYEDVCERITAATLQLERVKVVLEETTHRCEQLEKEKSEINAQSEHLSQNVVNVTTKYKDKLHTVKFRLEQTERDKREAQTRIEQLQNEIERVKDELISKNELIHEKDRLIQDTQYKNREMFYERQSIEEKVVHETKLLNELIEKNRLLEEEVDRLRRNQISQNLTLRRTEVDFSTHDSSKYIEELKLKINEYDKRFTEDIITKESLQIQIKILEEENIDLRDIMTQMRKRTQDEKRDERDRNNEIQQLIARAEYNARQYMTNLHLTTLPLSSAFTRIIPLSSSSTKT